MPDPTRTDIILDRTSKVAGILVPLVIGVVGFLYTANKDTADAKDRRTQDEQRTAALKAQMEQQQYTNFGALLPLIRSTAQSDHELALQIFASEAQAGQAPLSLLPLIQKLDVAKAFEAERQQAVSAGKQQQASQCNTLPEGIYLHVENRGQKPAAEKIGQELKSAGFNYRGVQQVDVVPKRTEIRYYSGATPPGEVDKIAAIIRQHGAQDIRASDISFLLRGCQPKRIYEIWFATDAQL